MKDSSSVYSSNSSSSIKNKRKLGKFKRNKIILNLEEN
jgi:hypothetical protein